MSLGVCDFGWSEEVGHRERTAPHATRASSAVRVSEADNTTDCCAAVAVKNAITVPMASFDTLRRRRVGSGTYVSH